MKVVVTGGTGFVGEAVCTALRSAGHEVVILSRSREGRDNGISIRKVDYHDIDSLAQAMDSCDAVIHLVGILHEDKGLSFEWAHHALVRNVVKAAAQANIDDYLHMSALGVDHRGPSKYLKSKADGEQAAFALCKQHGMRMVSMRPSIIFGENDNFFNQFARILKVAPVLPLVCPQAKFQPVAVEDVAKAFVWALESSVDRTAYELGGCEVMTMHEVVQRVCTAHGWKRLIVPLPDVISAIQGRIMSLIPGAPFAYDNYLSMQVSNTTEEWPWAQMCIEPKPVVIHKCD
ncbi:complex I NDUFA9 subunit family protein [Cardiobacteriaceae bacterium TAE3-ERU3]|nr:complex I NDUFA9 subunit family protein [Cardiobacteriaceae bacterium TAE3-ERU3]